MIMNDLIHVVRPLCMLQGPRSWSGGLFAAVQKCMKRFLQSLGEFMTPSPAPSTVRTYTQSLTVILFLRFQGMASVSNSRFPLTSSSN